MEDNDKQLLVAGVRAILEHAHGAMPDTDDWSYLLATLDDLTLLVVFPDAKEKAAVEGFTAIHAALSDAKG